MKKHISKRLILCLTMVAMSMTAFTGCDNAAETGSQVVDPPSNMVNSDSGIAETNKGEASSSRADSSTAGSADGGSTSSKKKFLFGNREPFCGIDEGKQCRVLSTDDYWISEDRFDLVGYLKACGSDFLCLYFVDYDWDSYWLDLNSESRKASDINVRFGLAANFKGADIMVDYLDETVFFLTYLNGEIVNWRYTNYGDWKYNGEPGAMSDHRDKIVIDDHGTTIPKGNIYFLPEALHILQNIPADADQAYFDSQGLRVSKDIY